MRNGCWRSRSSLRLKRAGAARLNELTLPDTHSEVLRAFVGAIRARSRALKHRFSILECERIIDDDGRESVLLRLRDRARNSLQLALRLWDDRWCWFDARRGAKQGWQFTWSYDGRVGPDTVDELIVALEKANEYVWETVDHVALEALWSPLLRRGPQV
jgi:hypothetical protein